MPIQTIERVGVGSLAKIYAAVGGVYGIFLALPVVLLGESLVPGSGIASFLFILFSSVIGAAIGGAITAVIYNLLAGAVGGVDLQLSSSSTPAQSQPATVDASE